MNQDLQVRFRPKTLRAMCGNPSTVKSLKGHLEKDTLPHFLLFHGGSGCGKTTLARILANELQVSDFSITEIDCATHNGIEMARNVSKDAYVPPLIGDIKFVIFDEAHQITKAGANGLLKTLEEPPPFTYFVFCTTEPKALIATIKNRATDYAVKGVKAKTMFKWLQKIAGRAEIVLPDDVLLEICETSDGSCRKALVSLNKVRSLTDRDEISEQLESILADEKSVPFAVAKEICYTKQPSWPKLVPLLAKLDKTEVERVRLTVLSCVEKALLDPTKHWCHVQCLNTFTYFETPFFNSGKAGLTAACFAAANRM